jgi:hypothetical protein
MYFYVICPVGTDPDFSAKRAILERAGVDCRLEAFFPLERRKVFSVAEAISDMQRSEFILADLSFERPSCYFELGLARYTRRPVHLIAAKGTLIHQVGDDSTSRVDYYADLDQYRQVVSMIFQPVVLAA